MGERGRRRDAEAYEEMRSLYCDGLTQQEIADIYGISRQCVQQKLKRLGVNRSHGGQHLRAIENKKIAGKLRDDLKDIHYMEYWGVDQRYFSYAMANYGKEFVDSYYQKKKNVETQRNESFDMTLRDYVRVWASSGKMFKRGQGSDRYVLTRLDKSGPWIKENALITTLEDCARRTNSKLIALS